MILKKKVSKKCLLIAVCILANILPPPVCAEPVIPLSAYEEMSPDINGVTFICRMVSVYEDFLGEYVEFTRDETVPADIPDGALKAVSAGFAEYERIPDFDAAITKQNAAMLIYKVITKYNPDFEITEAEADFILNSCYDNGELYPENRVAYAFCLKHGIFDNTVKTNPSRALTNTEADFVCQKMRNYFAESLIFKAGDTEIKMNEHIDRLIETAGNPQRIDKTPYGFSWYVYNTSYADYFMAGVDNDRICAFYSNAENFDFNGITKGSSWENTAISESVPGLKFYPDENGNTESVLFNPYEKSVEYDEEIITALKSELTDIINAHRTYNGMFTLNMTESVNKVNVLTDSSGYDVWEIFHKILLQKPENPDVINETITTSADISIDVSVSEAQEFFVTITTNTANHGILPAVVSEADTALQSFNVPKKDDIKTPEIISINPGDVLDASMDVLVELKDSVSDKYHLKIYDTEKKTEVVCQFITSEEKAFLLPKEIFTPGAEYLLDMCSIDGENHFYCEQINFTYGTADCAVSILSPFNDGLTYDSEIEVSLDSSVYHDFKLDIINSSGETIQTTILRDSLSAIMESIPSGKYTLQATALKRDTEIPCGESATTSFTIKKITPVISEFVLNPDEKFNFIYESPDSQYLYFYDEEIIYIDEEVTELVTEIVSEPMLDDNGNVIKDENGNVITINREVQKEVTKTVQSPRKKIIQKKVPATKQYRKLRCMYTSGSYTTGAVSSVHSTYMGDMIANTALKYQGIPYVWGGMSTSGFDCSGLVKYVSDSLGINVHRTSAEQFAYDGRYVLKSELIPGDLIFFQDNGVIHHVGIYIGDGKMVHAPHTGDVVRVASINSDYYIREYAGAKRISE